MTTQPHAQGYLAAIREQYNALETEGQKRREAGQGEYEVMIACHTPAGEIISVDNAFVHERSGTLQIEGEDEHGNLCDVIAHPQSAHLVLKLLPLPPETKPRPKPGFVHQ